MCLNLFVVMILTLLCTGYGSLLDAKEFSQSDEEKRHQESLEMEKLSLEIAKFYDLPDGVDILDITDKILASPLIKDKSKETIKTYHRQIFIFSYPSDGLQVKGVVSFAPSSAEKPLLIMLRGGNRTFGLLSPGRDYINHKDYTVIAPAYRGSVGEGKDEFGGDDVNDVKNLVDYIPELEKKLNQQLSNSTKYLIGLSRGGMQMFLALSRFPELQSQFAKIVSLSALANLRVCMDERPDMKQMFIDDFGLIENVNEEEWINKRDPMVAVDNLRKDLPILVVHGAKDNRVSRLETRSLFEKLEATGHAASYLEVEDGDHCLGNRVDKMDILLDWLEQ